MAATHTTNLGLNKPDRQDLVSVVTDINDNMDLIDAAIGNPSSASGVTGADAFSKIGSLNDNLANAIYNADCNNMTNANICYYADGNTANKPTGISSWLLIRVIGKAGGFITQIASEENVLNGRIWYRTKTSSTWGSWQELALNSKMTQERVALGSGATGVTKDGYFIYTPATTTVRVYGLATSSSDMNTNTVLATIPTGYRPKANSSGVCMIGLASGEYVPGACIFRTTGEIVQVHTQNARKVLFIGEYAV